MKTFMTASPAETKAAAADFAKALSPGSVVCMYGDLGAGKTAFVQGMAEGLGIAEPVTSPTFTIINEYDGSLPLYHFDVYRVGGSEGMAETGFDEYFYGDGICVIEWAELIEDILPKERICVIIKKLPELGDDFREITIEQALGSVMTEGVSK